MVSMGAAGITRRSVRIVQLVVILATVAMSVGAANSPTYILNCYSFRGMAGGNTAELAAKMKHRAGDRYTSADIVVDQAILTKALRDRHIKGRLFTGLA